MEGVHGVDVSWLHHSKKDHSSKTAKVTNDEKPSLESHTLAAHNASTISNGDNSHSTHTGPSSMIHPHLNQSISAHEKSKSPPQASSTPTKNSKDSKPGSVGRRNSWMTSLSSKFSSSNSNAAPAASDNDASNGAKAPKSPKVEQSNPLAAPSGAKDIKKAEAPSPSPPASPRNPGFLSSALRRLSSGGGTSLGKATGTGTICPRRTMNIDPYRERSAIPELDQNKLRRVAFCVDVEIAGSAQYVDDVEQPGAIPIDSEPSLSKLEREIAEKKKNKKQQKSEGEALKRPNAVVEEKETDGVVVPALENLASEKASDNVASEPVGSESLQEPSRKKEKKKRSESERKERKERKHQQALSNGSLPLEIKREGSEDSSNGGESPPKSQDRPTTDPLRIYRRCCQLRETPILKRITEQISAPDACAVATPGIISVLDLSGYWMQLPDIVTLADYLAVVPVKKLIMGNCGLGDEAVRVLLAGLLAAKTPEQARFNKKLVKKLHVKPENDVTEKLGVIEKVCLKNNPKIGIQGWRHIACFINLSRSLKAIDLSLIPFPEHIARNDSIKTHPSGHPHSHEAPPPPQQLDMSSIMQEAIAGRPGGNHLEELVMAECGLSTDAIGQIVDGVIKCGVTRLGLASNNLSKEGLEHITRFLRSGSCEGLDIGGNDIHEHLGMLSDALGKDNTLWALSLADCSLTPSSLETLLPVLTQQPNVRFIDLSHNRELFAKKPSALRLIRKYLPLFPILKRIHLMDVAMTTEHVIALAETLPECPALCHLNILENHLLTPLASAKTEEAQEEACAMYASLMAAVRVSDTLICIDIDVPSDDSGDIVKALAKQVVAYSLRNLERLPLESVLQGSAVANLTEPHGAPPKELTVPDVLLGLVGHVDGVPENHDYDPPAPDDDYIVGGTGVVKALDICLSRAERARHDSADLTPSQSGAGTPSKVLQDGEFAKGKAKEMSKNLLDSARKIRARLRPALIKEAKSGNEQSYRRLQFLDSTLQRMIQRFEDEFPETRLVPPPSDPSSLPLDAAAGDDILTDNPLDDSITANTTTIDEQAALSTSPPEADGSSPLIRPASISRRGSSPNLASRQAQEEGRMHRFGQRIKRDILRPQTEDHAHGTTGHEEEPEHLQELRRRLEALKGDEIRAKVEKYGADATLQEIETERLKREMGGWNPAGGEDENDETLEEWKGRMLGDAVAVVTGKTPATTAATTTTTTTAAAAASSS